MLKRGGIARKMFFPAVVFILTNATASATILDVPQKYQEKSQWCWAGCSQAILEYYGTIVPQTDIAAYGTPDTANTWNWLYGQSSSPTPVASRVKSLPAGFTYQLLSKAVPPNAPQGEYGLVAAFFDATKPIHGRADASLDVSARFTIR